MDATEIKRRFGRRVSALRRERGMTQPVLADRIERSVDTISNIETGRLSTRIETATKLAEALGVTLAELFEFGERGAADPERAAAVARLLKLVEALDLPHITALTEIAERVVSFR